MLTCCYSPQIAADVKSREPYPEAPVEAASEEYTPIANKAQAEVNDAPKEEEPKLESSYTTVPAPSPPVEDAVPEVAPAAPEGVAEVKSEEPWQDFMARSLLEKSSRKVPAMGKRRPSTNLPGLTFEKYLSTHENVFSELLSFEPMEGWTFKCEHEGTQIYTKSDPKRPNACFKAVCEISVQDGVHEIVDGLTDVENRKNWDEMLISGRLLESHYPFYRVSYTKLKAPSAVVSNRDLVILGRMRFEKDGSILLAMTSATHPDCPEDSSFVRAEMITGGYIIRPSGKANTFTVSWCGCVNPNGWIPSWIASLVAWKQGLTLPKFANYLKSRLASVA